MKKEVVKMYASLGIYILAPGKKEELLKRVEAIKDKRKDLKGYKKAVYFSDETRNEFGLLALWETKADCDEFIALNKKAHSSASAFAGTLFEDRAFYVNYLVE